MSVDGDGWDGDNYDGNGWGQIPVSPCSCLVITCVHTHSSNTWLLGVTSLSSLLFRQLLKTRLLQQLQFCSDEVC